MNISPISNINAAYAAFTGDGQRAGSQSPQSGANGSSHPVDQVWLSSEAQAQLNGTAAVDSDYASDSSGIG
jgi:hypothetical protein